MRKTFAQTFEQELQIEEQIAEKWGYSLQANELHLSKAASKAEKSLTINRNIVPRQIEKNKVQISRKHKQLKKQIEDYEYSKMMRQKATHKKQQFNAVKLMNDRIKQYNYLIQHKHIKDKNSDDTKRVLKTKPKSDAEIILQEINSKNSDLTKAEDLHNQFKLNKEITTLYRQYKDKMYGEKERTNSSRTKLNQTISTINKVNLSAIQNKKRQNSEQIGQGKTRLKNPNITSYSSNWTSKQKERINIEEPYVSKQFIIKNKELEKKIENEKQQVQVYKFKANNVASNLKTKKQKKAMKVTSLSENLMMAQDENEQVRISEENPLHRVRRESADYNAISFLKQKKKQQQKYFSTFLEKRNRKFKKPWGNKILIKYDSHTQAKQMLEGRSGTASPQKTGISFSPDKFAKTQKISTFRTIPKDISDIDKTLFQNMIEEQNDENLYEVMCKNEKINLFLKARKT